MSVWHIRGGRSLYGSVEVQGSKNAVLPIIAASLLTPGESELIRCPRLSDVAAAVDILRSLGCAAGQDGDTLRVDTRGLSRCEISRELMHRMRSSVIFLGPLLSRCGEAHVYVPGGCEIGPRPIDLHLHAMRCLGAEVQEEDGGIVCRAGKLRGAEISLSMPSVGATENAMIAACAAEGPTVIYNAAREPEIRALQEYLRLLGAEISGAGTPVVRVTGFVPRSHAIMHIPSDRIAAATYLCCAASAGGDVELEGTDPASVETILRALGEMGCRIRVGNGTLRLTAKPPLRAPESVVTRPYPGFPTDAAPLLMAVCARCRGSTVFIENIFESRYRHAEQLRRLGADIEIHGSLALVRGVETLRGAKVESPDLRGGAALITAALAAEGETMIRDQGHIRRGYDAPERVLRSLGAEIWTEE